MIAVCIVVIGFVFFFLLENSPTDGGRTLNSESTLVSNTKSKNSIAHCCERLLFILL